ncbi:Crp/Fnr family transcriptional regulator [Pedobacter sp. R-06]|uniref:Crp/Fnr family transcriptional regulator n=1 Tax=Pedobacter sp. R-06 TaxID=3404051 RepID=UPI003CF24B08
MEKEIYFEKMQAHLKPSIGLKAYLNYILQEDDFKRKKTIKLSDKLFDTLIFIESGTLRIYSRNEDGDTTIIFWFKKVFLPHMALLQQYATDELYVEFLEDSKILSFPQKHIPNLFKLFPEYRELEARIYQSHISKILQHSSALAHLDTLQRYEQLMETNPELFNLCELKNIANFLGIHPKVLSLLRSKAAKR